MVFIGHAETVSIVYPYSVFTSMWMTPVLWYVPGGARSAMRRIQERSTTSRGVRRDPPPHPVCAGREGGLGTGAYGEERNEKGCGVCGFNGRQCLVCPGALCRRPCRTMGTGVVAWGYSPGDRNRLPRFARRAVSRVQARHNHTGGVLGGQMYWENSLSQQALGFHPPWSCVSCGQARSLPSVHAWETCSPPSTACTFRIV